MIPKQKKLVALNADIRGMVQAIKDFKARRKSAIEANDYETAEQMWHNEKAMAKNLAEANYQKIKLYYSKADAIYEDKIIAICSLPGLIGMKEANLIECCAILTVASSTQFRKRGEQHERQRKHREYRNHGRISIIWMYKHPKEALRRSSKSILLG